MVPPSRPPPCSPTRRRGLHISDLVWQLVLAERAEMKETKVRYNKIAKAVLCHPRIQNLKPAIILLENLKSFLRQFDPMFHSNGSATSTQDISSEGKCLWRQPRSALLVHNANVNLLHIYFTKHSQYRTSNYGREYSSLYLAVLQNIS